MYAEWQDLLVPTRSADEWMSEDWGTVSALPAETPLSVSGICWQGLAQATLESSWHEDRST